MKTRQIGGWITRRQAGRQVGGRQAGRETGGGVFAFKGTEGDTTYVCREEESRDEGSYERRRRRRKPS